MLTFGKSLTLWWPNLAIKLNGDGSRGTQATLATNGRTLWPIKAWTKRWVDKAQPLSPWR
jgi:hypothetical protein